MIHGLRDSFDAICSLAADPQPVADVIERIQFRRRSGPIDKISSWLE